ncbi:unnamed protein product [Ascophyllum nodosum]
MEHHGQQRLATFVLAILLAAGPCDSTLRVYLNNGATSHPPLRFDDVPANYDFGPRIPSKGFSGRLQLAAPDIFACSPITGPAPLDARAQNSTTDQTPPEGDDWGQEGEKQGLRASSMADKVPIAVLVSRSVKGDPAACTFERKVINAQSAGYDLVVVFDSEPGDLFRMGMVSKEKDNPRIDIPVVLVTHSSGLALQTLLGTKTTNSSGLEVFLDSADPFTGMFITVNITMFVIIMGFMLTLLACGTMMVFTLHRYLRRYEELVAGSTRPLSLTEVLQLPEVQVGVGSTHEGETCPVCLELYRAGDELRILPCNHAFHEGCILPWLTQRQRTCPMCKDLVTVGAPTGPPPQEMHFQGRRAPFAYPLSPLSSSSSRSAEPGGSGGRRGDRLPLLANARGSQSRGGSIQETSPV